MGLLQRYSIGLILLIGINTVSFAQTKDTTGFKTFFKESIEYQLRGQFSIGGSTPLGMPAEIREINSYNPTLQLGLELNVTKWLSNDHKWGIRTGLRMEGRGMKTDARVKNYYTQIDGGDGKQTKGYFTGNVKTTMKNSYITFPVLVAYNASENWNAYGGLYLSGLIDKDFTGYVYDGVLREGTPIGTPVEFEGDAKGDYDFSEDLNRFQYGVQVGGEYKLNTHFRIFSDLNWGLNGVFKKDFDAISFKMYNIYLNLGFGYTF
ncbi:PorT family protein [Myroides odoratimimus]|uniref:porin family protein n=1 Tax=Myroides odoratimimus TaxID=76832 RepID=UPI0020968E4C|nr:porin family protein [Myroides odoratimimus]MCO7721771.1 PorT family protein [Myroides odoratimimus]